MLHSRWFNSSIASSNPRISENYFNDVRSRSTQNFLIGFEPFITHCLKYFDDIVANCKCISFGRIEDCGRHFLLVLQCAICITKQVAKVYTIDLLNLIFLFD